MTYPAAYEASYTGSTLTPEGGRVLHTAPGRALYAWAGGLLTRVDAGTAPPPVAGLLGWDEFADRTVTSGWGTADAGGDWVTTTGPTSVAGGAGLVTLTGTQRNASMRLPGAVGDSVQTRVRVALDKAGNGTGAFTLVRGRIVAGNEYRLKAQWSANLTMDVWLARSIGGVETQVGPVVSVPGGWDPNVPMAFVMETVGTSPTVARGKVWVASDPEPEAWLLSASDTTAALQEAGHTGLYVQLGSSASDVPVVARFTDFEVIPAGAPPQGPETVSGLFDDFTGATFDPARWPTRTQPDLSSIVGGRARMYLGGAVSGGMTDLRTAPGSVNLNDSYVQVTVPTIAASGANNREVGFTLTDPAGKFVQMHAANPSISVSCRVNTYGVNLNVDVTLPTDHRTWRIRLTDGRCIWESSADGQAWTVRRDDPSPGIDFTRLTLRLYAGYRDTSGAGTNETSVFSEFEDVWVGAYDPSAPTDPPDPEPETGLVGHINYADPTLRTTPYGPLVGLSQTWNLEDAVQTFETPKDGRWETGNYVPQRGVVARGADVPGAGQLWRPTAAARFEVRPGDEYASVMGDGSLYRTRRTEYRDRLGTSGTPFTRWPDPVGAETWYEFAYYLPPGYEFGGVGPRSSLGAMWTFLTQFKTLGGSPPLSIEVKREQLRLGGTQGGGRVIHDLSTGQWGRLRVGILTSVDPAVGWVEVHHNDGVPIPRTSMATTHLYNGQPAAHYLKQGLYEDYRWDTAPRDDGGTGVTHVAWLGPVRIARSLAALEG